MTEPHAMWEEYASATGAIGNYTAWAFGGDVDPTLSDELAGLVLAGRKRATTGLLAEYEDEGEPLPEPGDHGVILDGSGEAVCIIRTTRVEVRRFGDVDEEFAYTEGEGDRSLEYWRDGHIRFLARVGYDIDDDSRVVLERFEVVWPESVAD